MAVADSVVHLKRRVRNPDTELFEWRKCACRLSETGVLVLETVDKYVEGEKEGDASELRRAESLDGHNESGTASTRVIVDLAWQLHALEQKRKCKTRCELQYVEVATNGSKRVLSEELMAPSPRHCEEWIEIVREAEKRAKRRQSIREGTATASAVAAMSAITAPSTPLSSVSSSRNPLQAPQSVVSSVTEPAPSVSERSPIKSGMAVAPFDASLSSVSGSSMASSNAVGVSARVKPPIRRRIQAQPKQQAQPKASVLLSQHNRYDKDDEYGNEEEEEDDEEDAEEDALPNLIHSRATPSLPRTPSLPPNTRLLKPTGRTRPSLQNDTQLTNETTFDADDSAVTPTPRSDDEEAYHDQYSVPEYGDQCGEEEDDSEVLAEGYTFEQHPRPRTDPRPRPSLSNSTASAVARRKKPVVLSPPSSLSSPSYQAPMTRTHPFFSPRPSSVSSMLSPTRLARRPSSATLLPSSSSTTRRLRGAATTARRQRTHALRSTAGTSSAAAVAASIQRLRRREGLLASTDDDESVSLDRRRLHHLTRGDGEGDTREELDILMRVESALRHLEHENALAKEREAALAHQVSTLQDALRVRSAEKKHLEAHVQQLARDKDQWRQAAQRAEQALAQLQDELAIAQEETELQQSERHRLKHQNKELLSQVHRLDSIVYGRF